MNKKKLERKFIGTWKLNKWVVSKPDGKETYPFLGNVNGFLIYHPDGWMSATLMQKDRSHVSDNRSEISKIAYELKNNTVSIRTRDGDNLGEMGVEKFIKMLETLVDTKSRKLTT